jgi:hypothetical protein
MKTAKTNVKHIEQARADITFNGKKAIMSLDWEKPSRFYTWTRAMKKYAGDLVARTPKQRDLQQKQHQLAADWKDSHSVGFSPTFLRLLRKAYLKEIRQDPNRIPSDAVPKGRDQGETAIIKALKGKWRRRGGVHYAPVSKAQAKKLGLSKFPEPGKWKALSDDLHLFMDKSGKLEFQYDGVKKLGQAAAGAAAAGDKAASRALPTWTTPRKRSSLPRWTRAGRPTPKALLREPAKPANGRTSWTRRAVS